MWKRSLSLLQHKLTVTAVYVCCALCSLALLHKHEAELLKSYCGADQRVHALLQVLVAPRSARIRDFGHAACQYSVIMVSEAIRQGLRCTPKPVFEDQVMEQLHRR
jgi:hypothetical protein